MDNLSIWNSVKTPPKEAIKEIPAGRLKGKSDISPQWRILALTQLFGPVGFGWKYTIERQWIEVGEGVEKCAFCNILLYVKNGDVWSEPIPGTGGSAFVTREKSGPFTSDEAFKMALTDALSVAMKALGVAATIYSGGNDFSKYTNPKNDGGRAGVPTLTEDQIAEVESLLRESRNSPQSFCNYMQVSSVEDIPQSAYKTAIDALSRIIEQRRVA